MQTAIEPEQIAMTASDISPNDTLPVLVYREAFPKGDVEAIKTRLTANGWDPMWVEPTGFFPFHHFHSLAHELLVIVQGEVGGYFGADGALGTAKAGDAVVLPAGTDHIAAFSSEDLLIVGAYPRGQKVDVCRGEPENDATVRANIAALGRPATDPVSGEAEGYLPRIWAH